MASNDRVQDATEIQAGDEAGEVPNIAIRQVKAVAATEHNPKMLSRAERKHMGRDVPIPNASPQDDHHPPSHPAIGDAYGEVSQEQEGFGTKACVAEDGRVNIRINQKNRKLSQILLPVLRRQQSITEHQHVPPKPYIPPSLGGSESIPPPPPMNIVMHVVGSRGDVQPFIALGKVLKDTYGHRVRLATHPNFKEFVIENGLEFFSIGGDPAALMAFMVKNPGLMPGFDSLRAGDVGKRRKEVAEYLRGCWRSCFETGDGSGVEATDDTIDDWMAHHPDDQNYLVTPFVADAIIANPPSFAGIHCAEKMGIPLHAMFTMPYSPTQAFPHPLANIQSSNADDSLTNYISYALIDMLTWQGLGDVINRFRHDSLGLEPLSLLWAPGLLQRLQIPFTYCWSPALIPKPRDWGSNVSISGFYFLDLATNYTPEPDLAAFLAAGPPPVYIGFGSIVLDDPNGMTKLIFEAVRKTGQRALVSKGWGGMGADELGKPDNVFMLGNCPHDWLFTKVSCVVHHGGAGTTAAGIRAGRPTLVVPFFGDQPFWGSMVARAGAGPEPIPHKQLTADNLAEGILKCLESQSLERAAELAQKITTETGSDVGAQSFHQFLDVDKMRCNLIPSQVAVWRIKRTQVRLSALAACTLASEGLLDFNDIKLYRSREYETEDGPWEPITGGATALIGTIGTIMLGVADFPVETLKALRIHPDAKKKSETKHDSSGSSTGMHTPNTPGTPREDPHDPMMTPMLLESPVALASHSGESSGTPTVARSSSTFNVQESLAKLSSSSDGSGAENRAYKRVSSSMADALRGNLESTSRTRSRSGSGTRSRGASLSNGSAHIINQVTETGKGVNRIVGAGLKSPMDFSLGLAKGFHNAPKLYGDDTVRQSERITDFRSGLKAATKEFGYGFYDGITGLVTQPVRGAAKEGAAGFLKGVGKGIGGLVLKPGAAIWGIPGYTMKGLYKELQKHFGSSVQNYMIAARTAQGYAAWQRSTQEERDLIVSRWQVLQKDIKKKRNPDELVKDILEEQMRKHETWIETKKAERREEKRLRSNTRTRTRTSSPARNRAASSVAYNHFVAEHDPDVVLLEQGKLAATQEHRHRAHTYEPPSSHLDPNVINETIRLSVEATSIGDEEDDALVEQGLRASLLDLERCRSSRADRHEAEELSKALAASEADALEHQRQEEKLFEDQLQRVLTQSLKEHRGWTLSPPQDPPAYDDIAEDSPALTESAGQGRSERLSIADVKTPAQKTEEDIVLEYVKKQSLLEEEYRLRVLAQPPTIRVEEGSAGERPAKSA